MLAEPLDQFIAAVADYLAHTRGEPLPVTCRAVRNPVEQARQEYREDGATYGGAAAWLLRWLSQCRPATPVAYGTSRDVMLFAFSKSDQTIYNWIESGVFKNVVA